VLCPLISIAAAINTALEILRGNISIAYDIHAPPKSCPTKITFIRIQKVRKYIKKKEKNFPRELGLRFCTTNIAS